MLNAQCLMHYELSIRYLTIKDMTSDILPHFYSLVKHRYSCRDYSDRPVSDDTLMAVLDMARLAPSACNRQPWLFLIADGDDERQAILDSYKRDWIRTAPASSSLWATTRRHGTVPKTARTTPTSMSR